MTFTLLEVCVRKKLLHLLFTVCLILFCWLIFACECFCAREIFSWKKNEQAWNCLDNLILLYYWVKNLLETPFGETPWLTGRHATPLVTLLFGTASATDLRERFLLSGIFYLTFHPAGFRCLPGAGGSTSKLAGFHADLRNIAPAQLFVWITTIQKTKKLHDTKTVQQWEEGKRRKNWHIRYITYWHIRYITYTKFYHMSSMYIYILYKLFHIHNILSWWLVHWTLT